MKTPLRHATVACQPIALRVVALCVAFGSATCLAQSAVIDGFTPTGNLPAQQLDLNAVTLSTGKVFLTNGMNVDLYDPATQTFSTGTALMVPHGGGSPGTFSTTLLSNGRVLIAGGGMGIADAELFDPASGTSSATSSLNQARQSHSAVRLLDGRVLVTGGEVWDDDAGHWQQIDSNEIYDPQTAQFAMTGSMHYPRLFAFANLLHDGTVLISGGLTVSTDGSVSYPPTAELFDPVTGTFSDTADMATIHLAYLSTATTLRDGRVLFTSDWYYGATAEIYDPLLASFSPAGIMQESRSYHSAHLLPDGKVLVVGGWNGVTTASTELFDPLTGSFSLSGSMLSPRHRHGAATLGGGRVLVAGGSDWDGTGKFGDSFLDSAEIYTSDAIFIDSFDGY